MKIYRTIILLIFLFLPGCIYNIQAQALTRVKEFGNNPGRLKMYMYSPASLNKNAKAAVVVVLHGCLQSAVVVAKQSGWNKLADTYGFNVVYPEQRIINNPQKCFCWYRNKDINKWQGESFSIEQMVEYVKQNYNVDTTQIFVTGLSAGAAMGVVMLADYPQVFKAGAIFAGAPYKVATNIFTGTLAFYGWRRKSPEKWAALVRAQNPDYAGPYPKLIIYHGNADVVVNRRNGYELMKQWTALNGVSTQPTETIHGFLNNKCIERNAYCDANRKELVIYYRIKRLGHALLIDPGKCLQQGGKRTAFSADKNYFSAYWTAVDFGLIKPGEISGRNYVQRNEQVTFSVPANSSAQFKWHFPKDCTLLADQGNTIILRWGSNPGNVDVTQTEGAKCKFIYPTLPVHIVEQ